MIWAMVIASVAWAAFILQTARADYLNRMLQRERDDNERMRRLFYSAGMTV